MGGCCYSCLKYLVMIFNLMFMLIGLTLFGCVLWLYLDQQLYLEIAKNEDYNYIIYFFIAVSAVVIVVSFLGCCGALQESQCMLATFFCLMFVLVIAEVSAVVWNYQNGNSFKSLLEDSITKSVKEEYSIDNTKTLAMDTIQQEFQCCGSTGTKDYMSSKFSRDSTTEIGIGSSPINYSVPRSCCNKMLSVEACDAARKFSGVVAVNPSIYSEGCSKKIIKFLEGHAWVLFIVLLVVGLLELLAMIFSLVLCCAVRAIDRFKA